MTGFIHVPYLQLRHYTSLPSQIFIYIIFSLLCCAGNLTVCTDVMIVVVVVLVIVVDGTASVIGA